MAPNQKLTWADILPGSHDPNARLSVMDEERIERALLFPSVHLLWGDIRDPAVAAETCRAYNNWMSDFCKTAPNRLCAMGIVPLQDIDLAVREARRLRELGLSGLISRPERFGDLAPFGQMAVMMDLIAGGVMDRFPDLRVGFFESGLGWMPHWIDRLDEHFEVMGHQTPWLKRRPSEIFAAQCFVSMEADEAAGLQWMAGKGLANCILWGTDYPYFDSTYPGAFGEAEKSFFAAGPDIADLVVLQNPTRFMGLGG